MNMKASKQCKTKLNVLILAILNVNPLKTLFIKIYSPTLHQHRIIKGFKRPFYPHPFKVTLN